MTGTDVAHGAHRRTAPHVAPWTVTIATEDGGEPMREIHVGRGETVDLGAIVV